ncbi:photosystem I reaction center subunit XII [Synechococcus sp. PCC 7336]|nr:photosystem I reaction center subunit XII [Synechococcus sp. PCC 7336]
MALSESQIFFILFHALVPAVFAVLLGSSLAEG